MTTPQPAEATAYTAACHCRTIQLTFTLPAPLTSPSTMKVHCNCSICTRNGYLLCYPLRSEVVFPMQKQDPTKMGAYMLGSRRKPHYFCKTCGSSMWIDFQDSQFEKEREMIAVNMRMIDGTDDYLEELEFKRFDGRTRLLPAYRSGEAETETPA